MGSIDRFLLTGSGHENPLALATEALSRHLEPRRRWTQADVGTLMDTLHPCAAGPANDHARQQQRLCSAYLAGVAESQDDHLLRPSRQLVATSIETARALLKNRAASEQARLWHAFTAGAHAARAQAAPMAARHHELPFDKYSEPVRLFIRQPFTESNQSQQNLIASVLAQVDEHNGDPHSFRYLTGKKAESADTFKASFESESGRPFTPQAFGAYRLNLLDQAEAFINIRVGMSESSAFELCYHIFKGACTPVLFLVWKHAPIKTTLLKDLGNLCDITYLEFEHADDLRAGMGEFFRRNKRDACTNDRASAT